MIWFRKKKEERLIQILEKNIYFFLNTTYYLEKYKD